VAPEDIERSRKNMQLMFAGGIRQSSEYTWIRKDGRRFPVLLTSVPVKDEKGNIVGARGIISDLTERKAMEKQLQDGERLAAIGQTAGMIGHDIRNPLQAIVSELYMAKEVMTQMPDGKDKQEGLESVNFVQEQIDYVNKIVTDLQDYARPLKPEYSIVDLSDLLVSVFDTITLSDTIRLKVDVKDNLKLKTDPTFVKRAVTNLVNNAVQAMPDGGELGLSVQKREDCVVVCVSDTGNGIPDSVKDNLFKPLTTTKAKGQGLGLAVVKRLVEGLNGKVHFESEQGKGTKFFLELPAQ
jgi:signal transduction histidine kinase